MPWLFRSLTRRKTVIVEPGLEGIAKDLAALGHDVRTIADLRALKPFPDDVAGVVEQNVFLVPGKTRTALVSMLGKKWAAAKLDELIAQFSAGQRPGGEGMWFVGDNIYSLWSDTRFEDLARLATDVDKGPDRQMIVLGLGRSKRPEAVDVLLSLLDQYSVSGHAAEALAKLRTERARPGLEEMTGDDRDWVVRAAKRGLAALDKAAAEGTP